MGALQVHSFFDVSNHFGMFSLPGAAFIGWCNFGIFASESKLVPLQSLLVPLIVAKWVRGISKHTIRILARRYRIQYSYQMRVECDRMPPKAESTVMTKQSRSDMMTIERRCNHDTLTKHLLAIGIEDCRFHHIFQIIITNVSRKPGLLHNHMINAIGIKPLRAVIRVCEDNTDPARMDLEPTMNRE